MNSQCECLRQMDEHLSAIGSHERVRFIFKACLSHFSCLVLEGRACICDFSNARDLQWFSSLWDWALWAKISRTFGFFLLRMRTKGCRFSKGYLSMPVGLSNSSTRLFCSMNWPLGLGRDVGGLLRCDLRDGLSGLFCQRCSPSQDDVPSSTRGCFQWSLGSAVTPSNHQGFWDS